MLKLPKIPYSMEKNKQQVVSLGNVNYSKMIKDGDVADSSGISGRHFPYITTAKENVGQERSFKEDGVRLAAITVFRGKFVEIYDNGYVFYGGEYAGALQGKKEDYSDIQFAAINTKLVIMPFKVYLDTSGEIVELKNLGVKMDKFGKVTFTSDSLSLSGLAAHTFRSIGGSLGTDKKTINIKSCVLSRDLNDGYTYLRVATSGNESVLSIWSNVAASDRWDEKTIWAYLLDSEIDLMRQYGVVISDKKNDENCKWCPVISIENDTEFSNSIDYYKIKLADGFSLDCSKYPSVISICAVNTKEEPFIAHALTAKMKIERPGVFGSEYWGTLNHSSGPEWETTFTPREGSRAPNNGVYTGMLTDGGLTEDLQSYIFEGRRVIVTCETLDSDGELREWSCGGVVESAGLNSITFVEEITPSATIDVEDCSYIEIFVEKKEENFDMNEIFAVGDAVTVSGCSEAKNNITFLIDSISDKGTTLVAPSDVFESGEFGSGCTIERRIPRLDYICEHDNRLYGCSNEDNTIYASALGDPTNIYAYKGVSTDSYAVAVASEEPFTGCCPYDGGVMFWKENKLHKLLGSYPAEYALYTYNIDGVQEGSHKSLQNIGEVLYYKGVRGVFAFDGSPRLISENFGDKNFKGAVGGSDGGSYYISMADEAGRSHFFSYNTRIGLWVRESGAEVSCFARKGKDTYMLEGGEIKLYGAEDAGTDNEWFVQFTPIYETIEGKKSYSRIKLRVELPRGSYMVISVRCDGGRWAECGKVIGRVDGVVPVMIPINRCDKFELKIEGKGPCTIHSILREYYIGGDR